MNPLIIRRVGSEDLERLQRIGRQTFYETFTDGNTEENMRQYLEEGFSGEKLLRELGDRHSEFYFAEMDNTVIGYLKLNTGPSQTEIKSENALEIERIYVLQEYHGNKVGQLLYNKALEIAREKGVDFLWLGVWEKNTRAIGFYKKNGFVEFDKHLFRLGDDEQTDIMMKKTLKEN